MDTIETVENLHNKAMDLAEAAFRAKSAGNEQEFVEFSNQAYEFEIQAAERFRNDTAEPTRSILFRSAASLAFNAQNYAQAENLAKVGLSGNPPQSVAGELRDLLNQIFSHKHFNNNYPAEESTQVT